MLLPFVLVFAATYVNSAMTSHGNRANEHNQDTKCGYRSPILHVGDSGSVISPGYPTGYPSLLHCLWWLESVPGSKIELICHDIHTQPCVPQPYDYLLLATDWSWKDYSVYCGDVDKLPISIESEENKLSLFFRSSMKISGRGVNCSYQVITDDSNNINLPTSSESLFNGDDSCGKAADMEDQRIVGGVAARPHEFPWIIGLSLNNAWFCGGSLISHNWVLTAAHCLSGVSDIDVLLGVHRLQSYDPNGIVLKSKEFFVHPEYNSERIMNDVGLILLPRRVEFSERIRPACLPLRKTFEENLTGNTLIAAGWGKTSDNGTISDQLNKLTVEVVSNEDCKKSYGPIIHDSTLCAIGIDRGTGTCQGDSGSSLQYEIGDRRWVQVGVVSFGAAVGCVNQHPNGYSKIVHYLDWITNVTDINFK